MQFKKTNIDENAIQDIKEFANNASGETSLQKTEKNITKRKKKEENKRNKISFDIFLEDELKNKIQDEVTGALGSRSEFLKKIILEENIYIQNDKDLIEIYNIVQKEGISPKSFIRKKLGLDTNIEKFNYDKKNKKKVITAWISNEYREKIYEKANQTHSTMRAYAYAKILFYLETKNLFSFEEQMQLTKEANNYDLDFKEFLTLKIKNN